MDDVRKRRMRARQVRGPEAAQLKRDVRQSPQFRVRLAKLNQQRAAEGKRALGVREAPFNLVNRVRL